MVPMAMLVLDIMAMLLDTPTPTTMESTAREMLMLRLSPTMVPMAMLVLAMDIMLMAMLDTPTPTTMESTARGRLMLSPTTDLDTAATDMPVPTMATAAMAVDTTGDKSSDHTAPWLDEGRPTNAQYFYFFTSLTIFQCSAS